MGRRNDKELWTSDVASVYELTMRYAKVFDELQCVAGTLIELSVDADS
jgi:hypothetical protein